MAAPYTVVSSNVATGSASLTTAAAALSAPVGDLVYVAAGNSGGDTITTALTDTAGNTWSVALPQITGVTQRVTLYASILTHAIVSGTTTFSATWSSTTGAKFLIARGCTGISSATPDAHPTMASGTSAAPSSASSGTLGQANELLVGVVQNAAATISLPSFGTLITSTNSASCSVFDAVVASNSAVSASATLSTSVVWMAGIATFKFTLLPRPVVISQARQRAALY